jgi:hypothetical protein
VRGYAPCGERVRARVAGRGARGAGRGRVWAGAHRELKARDEGVGIADQLDARVAV